MPLPAALATRKNDSVFARLGEAALWKAGGVGAGVSVTILRAEPDEDVNFGARSARVTSILIRVRASDISAPALGDRVEPAGPPLKLIGTPKADAQRLVWTCEAVETV